MRKSVTWTEWGIVLALFVALGILFVPVLAGDLTLELRASCADNLRQIGVSLRMYADEAAGGFYPPMAMHYGPDVDCSFVDENGVATYPVVDVDDHIFTSFNVDTMFPEYFDDFTLMVCPADVGWTEKDLYNPDTRQIDLPYRCDDLGREYTRGSQLLSFSYSYFGWVFDKPRMVPDILVLASDTFFTPEERDWPPDALLSAQMCAWLIQLYSTTFTPPESYALQSRSDLFLDGYATSACGGYLPTSFGNGDSNTLYRLREGAWRFLITDINNPSAGAETASEIYTVIDRIDPVRDEEFNHFPDGGNVLFLDGHVEFLELSGPVLANAPDAYFGSLAPISTPTRGIKPPPDVPPVALYGLSPESGPVLGIRRVALFGNFPAIETVEDAENHYVVKFGDKVAAFSGLSVKTVGAGVLYVNAPVQTFTETTRVDVTVAEASDSANVAVLPAAYTYLPNVQDSNDPILDISTEALDFGTVTVGDVVEKRFVVRNGGGDLLEGTVSVSAPFVVSGGAAFSLGEDETQVVTIRFAPVSAGDFSILAGFIVDGTSSVTLSGIAVPEGGK